MSAETELVLRESLALDLRRRSLQMVLRACEDQHFAFLSGLVSAHTPVLSVAAMRLQREVVLNLFLQIGKAIRVQAL